MKRLCVYYLDPIEGRKRKYVMPQPPDEQVEHYLEVAAILAAGTRVRTVGLYGFCEEDLETGQLGGRVDVFAQPSGIKTIRVEGDEPAAAPVQQTLMEVAA